MWGLSQVMKLWRYSTPWFQSDALNNIFLWNSATKFLSSYHDKVNNMKKKRLILSKKIWKFDILLLLHIITSYCCIFESSGHVRVLLLIMMILICMSYWTRISDVVLVVQTRCLVFLRQGQRLAALCTLTRTRHFSFTKLCKGVIATKMWLQPCVTYYIPDHSRQHL